MISFKQYGGKGGDGGSIADIVKYYTAEKEYSQEFKALLEAEAAKHGISNYYASGEQPRDRMTWHGKACKALGVIEGQEVRPEELTRLLGGYHAQSGKALVQNAGAEDRRMAADFTFSAPKSVSILIGCAEGEERQRLLEIHEAAVRKVAGFMLEHLEVRRGKGGAEHSKAAGACYATKTEATSRAGEWDIHTHGLFLNLAEGEDGKISAADMKQLLKLREPGDALYKAELAIGLRAEGYGIKNERARDAFDNPLNRTSIGVAGISRENEEKLSTRQKEITAAVEKSEGRISRQTACLATRDGKEDRPWLEATANAAAIAEARGVRYSPEFLRGREDEISDKPETARELLDILHAQDATYSRGEVLKTIAYHWGDSLGMDGVMAEAERWQSEGLIEERGQDQRGEPIYAAAHYVEAERAFRQSCLDRANDPTARMEPERAEAAMAAHEQAQSERLGAPFRFDQEQREAVQGVLCQTGGTTVLNGKPGAGKTASVGACIRAWQSEGREVIGLAPSERAARVLEADTGIPCYNLDAYLAQVKNGTLQAKPGTAYVTDESGMAGMSHMAKIQALANVQAPDGRAGKLLLMGDEKQHAAVNAGSAHIAAAEMLGMTDAGSIKRQKDPAQLELAKMLSSPESQHSGEEIAAYMRTHDRLKTVGQGQDTAPACAEIAKQWMKGEYTDEKGQKQTAPIDTRLVIAADHKDRNQVNRLIQEARAEHGDTRAFTDSEGKARTVALPLLDRAEKSGRGSRAAERLQEVREGERITFTGNVKPKPGREAESLEGKGVSKGYAVNGETGTVIGYRDHYTSASGKKVNEPTLIVRMDNQAMGEVEFQPHRNKRWDLGYAGTSHYGQGMTVNRSWEIAPQARGEMRNAALVNNTRARYQHTVIGPEARTQDYAEVCGGFHRKANAMGREEVSAMTPSPPPLSQRLGAEVSRGLGQWQEQARQREHARAQAQQPQQQQQRAQVWSMER